jgi:N-acetylglutamate synthase-like GNAT family acetyltransferase
MKTNIRRAVKDDCPRLLELVQELATMKRLLMKSLLHWIISPRVVLANTRFGGPSLLK